MGTMMPAADHIREVPSDWDTDTHATEPANNDTTIRSVVKKSNFDELFCFNVRCLLTVCDIGIARIFVIWLINLKITIMLDHIRVASSELDKKIHHVLCTTDRSELVSGHAKNFKTDSVTTSQLLKLNGTIPGMIRNNREVLKQHVVATENSFTAGNYADCNFNHLYPVLVGNTVRTYNTKLFASLPQQNKYMVKQRVRDASGATKIKLVLQSSNER